jgi:hypothetical protein
LGHDESHRFRPVNHCLAVHRPAIHRPIEYRPAEQSGLRAVLSAAETSRRPHGLRKGIVGGLGRLYGPGGGFFGVWGSMKTPHLLRVEDAPDRFAPLIDAARALGLRTGWLDLGGDLGSAPAPLPEPLETAAGLGVLRAVAVGEGRTVAVKPLRGAPVLKDLLREHFQGCTLVLLRGPIDAPTLRLEGDAWLVTPPGSASRRYTTSDLALALRKSRPWGEPSGDPPA